MNYRHVYCVIISHAKLEEKLGLRKKGNGTYYEAHHILPRSLFPLWENRKSNIVLLTAREHFFCHQLLSKIYPCREMILAIRFLALDCKHSPSSREYEELRKLKGDIMNPYLNGVKDSTRRKMSKSAKKRMREGRNKSFENQIFKKGNEPWNKGKAGCYSEETIEKIRKNSKHIPMYENILCVETGEIFSTVNDIKARYPNASHICEAIIGDREYCVGYHWKALKMNYIKGKNPKITELYHKING